MSLLVWRRSHKQSQTPAKALGLRSPGQFVNLQLLTWSGQGVCEFLMKYSLQGEYLLGLGFSPTREKHSLQAGGE